MRGDRAQPGIYMWGTGEGGARDGTRRWEIGDVLDWMSAGKGRQRSTVGSRVSGNLIYLNDAFLDFGSEYEM